MKVQSTHCTISLLVLFQFLQCNYSSDLPLLVSHLFIVELESSKDLFLESLAPTLHTEIKSRNRKCSRLLTPSLYPPPNFKKKRLFEGGNVMKNRLQVLRPNASVFPCVLISVDCWSLDNKDALRAPSLQFSSSHRPPLTPFFFFSPSFSPPPHLLCLHAVLQLKLQQRRTREELVSQGIMPRKSFDLLLECHTPYARDAHTQQEELEQRRLGRFIVVVCESALWCLIGTCADCVSLSVTLRHPIADWMLYCINTEVFWFITSMCRWLSHTQFDFLQRKPYLRRFCITFSP